MDAAIRRLIEAIHAAPGRCVLAVTGGGTQAGAMLLNAPGGSRTVLEIIVPYHEQALVDFLGHSPASFCSPETSLEMASRALDRARWLGPGKRVVGLGCTAALATNHPKRGAHRFHIATNDGVLQTISSLVLTKDAREREAEEAVLDLVLLNAVAEAFNIKERLAVSLLPGEKEETDHRQETDALTQFFLGRQSTVCNELDGLVRADAPRPLALMPGAFNPCHLGHWQLAEVAGIQAGGPVAFELSVINVDKPGLTAEEVRQRIAQFTWRAPLWLTRAPTFVEKSALFPGVCFVVGVDTAIRLVQPRYYQDSEERMIESLEAIRARGCRFLVAGRLDASGRFAALEDVAIPEQFREMFTPIPETAFRVDLSSTWLRQCAGEGNVTV
jgi:hypothetical protein